MTLRLVLVSLVAALGLTIPGGPMLESWVATTQNWMNARFADWDTRNPQEADYVIINDHYDGALAAARQERPRGDTSLETGVDGAGDDRSEARAGRLAHRRLDRQQERRAARLVRPQRRQLHADRDDWPRPSRHRLRRRPEPAERRDRFGPPAGRSTWRRPPPVRALRRRRHDLCGDGLRWRAGHPGREGRYSRHRRPYSGVFPAPPRRGSHRSSSPKTTTPASLTNSTA